MNSNERRREILSSWLYDTLIQTGGQSFKQLYEGFRTHISARPQLDDDRIIGERQFRIDLEEMTQTPFFGYDLIYAQRQYSLQLPAEKQFDLVFTSNSNDLHFLDALLNSLKLLPTAQSLTKALHAKTDNAGNGIGYAADFLEQVQHFIDALQKVHLAIQTGQAFDFKDEETTSLGVFAPVHITIGENFRTTVHGFRLNRDAAAEASSTRLIENIGNEAAAVALTFGKAHWLIEKHALAQSAPWKLSANVRQQLAVLFEMGKDQLSNAQFREEFTILEDAIKTQGNVVMPGNPAEWVRQYLIYNQHKEDYIDLFRGKNTRAARWVADPDAPHPYEAHLQADQPIGKIRYILISEAPPKEDRSTYFYNPNHLERTHWLNAPLGAFDYPVNPKSKEEKIAALVHLARQGVLLLELYPIPMSQQADRSSLIKAGVAANYWANKENILSVANQLEQLGPLLHAQWDLCLIAPEETTDFLLESKNINTINLLNGPKGLHPEHFRRKSKKPFTQKAVLESYDPENGEKSRPSFPTAELIKKAFDYPTVYWPEAKDMANDSRAYGGTYPHDMVRPERIKLLIIAENIPDMSKAWCRVLLKDIEPAGANNMLTNVCRCFGIQGFDEKDMLMQLLDKGIFIIDTHPPGQAWHPLLPPIPVTQILEEIAQLNPKHILVTSKRSNKFLIPALFEAGHQLVPLVDRPDHREPEDWVFPSPSNRAYQRFKEAIDLRWGELKEILA